MKKLLITILSSTLLLGGCAGAEMQTKVEDLTQQVTTLTEEKKELEVHHQKDEKHVELLCAIIGEQSTAPPGMPPMVEYLGDGTFRHTVTGEVHKMEDMLKRCIDMVDSFDALVQKRAASLLEEPKNETKPE